MMRHFRHSSILLVAALTAMCVLVGASMHVHHDDDHLECWLCIAALGMIGIAAVTVVAFVKWDIVSFLPITCLTTSPRFCITPHASRAPPMVID